MRFGISFEDQHLNMISSYLWYVRDVFIGPLPAAGGRKPGDEQKIHGCCSHQECIRERLHVNHVMLFFHV